MENIVIIGFMGSGKSSVGRELARATQRFFIDSDFIISARENLSIPEIFNLKGEGYFRQLEGDFIHWAKKSLRNTIISTGGGMPIFNDISSVGQIIYLKIEFDEIIKRLSFDEMQKRPLFEDISKARVLYEERKNIYERVADKVIDANTSIGEIIEKILR